MRNVILIILMIFCISGGLSACSQSTQKTEKQQNQTGFKQFPIIDTCRTIEQIESHWNSDAIVEGRVVEYVPPHDSSKLGDEKIWNWEIVLADNYSIPLTSKDKNLDINKFVGKNVC